jgi:hypothetical protein
MTDQPEITNKKSPDQDSQKEEPLSGAFSSRPADAELKSLAFVESSKELNQYIEQPPTEELLKNKEAQKEVIDKVVDKVHQEVSLDTKIPTPEDIDLIRAGHASMHGEINAEIRETLGENSEVQQLEARVESWRTRNINKALDMEAKIRQQEKSELKELQNKQASEQKKRESYSKAQGKTPAPLWGIGQNKKPPKSVIDLLVDRILEILGLKEPEQSKKRSQKGKGSSDQTDNKKDDEPFLKKILRLIGIIE